MKKLWVVLVCLTLAAGSLFAKGGQPQSAGEYPHSETVFLFSGMSNTPTDMNPIGVNPNFPVSGISDIMFVYETLFMMNMVTGELEPLVADSYSWVDDLTLEIKINPGVTFSDGRKASAEDVAYSYTLGQKYAINWSTYWQNFDTVTAVDSTTVRIKMKASNPNKLNALDSLQGVPVLPKHIWEKVESDNGSNISRIRSNFTNMNNPIGTGAFRVKGYDSQRVVLERNDSYWGVGPRFRALPAMKYIVNVAYPDNNALALAFRSNEVDLAQAFIPNIWDMIKANPKISCYYDDLPYHMPGGMVAIEFNLKKPGLDNPAVRRALSYAINYQQVADSAMSGYSAQLDPLLVLPTETAYKDYIDHSALAGLKYRYDPDTARKILDDAGIRDSNGDGIRELNGRPLSFTIQTGDGWTDWNAAAEVVSHGARAVGIEIITETPEGGIFVANRTTGNYDLALTIPGEGIRPSQPWFRYNWTLSDVGLPPMGEVRHSNQSGYSNPAANRILVEIPTVTDRARLRTLHTEINRIFLQDLPILPIMYRPFQFYEVNSTYWTGWPHNGDGTNNPPMIDRYAGLKTFFAIKPVK
jgi:peptide/nickel transport system substrate-binding protein